MPLPGITYPGQLKGVSDVVWREWEAFLAQLNEGYLLAEHKDDGSHGRVNADSVRFNSDDDAAILAEWVEGPTSFASVLLPWIGLKNDRDPTTYGGLLLGALEVTGTAAFLGSLFVDDVIGDSFFGTLFSATTAVIIGGQDTNGIRQDVSGGVLRVREGDNSADAGMLAAFLTASIQVRSPFYIVGTQDTSGIRLDVSGGDLRVREGDDTAAAGLIASFGVFDLLVRTPAYIIGTQDTSGARLDIESGAVAVREGDDTAYNSVNAAFYKESDTIGGGIRSAAMGYWNTYAYSAGNFTASGSMTWGVDDADEVFTFSRVGVQLHLEGFVQQSDVGGTASTGLRLTLPATLAGATGSTQRGQFMYQEGGAGAFIVGYWEVASASTFIEFKKLDGSNWALTTLDDTYVHVSCTIHVNPI